MQLTTGAGHAGHAGDVSAFQRVNLDSLGLEQSPASPASPAVGLVIAAPSISESTPALAVTEPGNTVDEHDDKPDGDPSPAKRTPPSRKGIAPANAWPKGVSGNPAGRPKKLEAFAERVRERVDPDLVIDLAMRVAEDEKLAPSTRLAALWPLVDRGWVKPPADARVHVEGSTTSGTDWSAVPIEARLAALQALRAARESSAIAPADNASPTTNGTTVAPSAESPTENER